MPTTGYTKADLETMVLDERRKVKVENNFRLTRVQRWWVMVHEKGASLSITFEVDNRASGEHPTITTRTIAL